MLYDLTLGFNELDLFDVRYNELKRIVDKFVIVESTHTHRGTPKALYFSESVKDYSDVEILVWDNGADFAPLDPQYAWVRENYQREILGHWVKNNCAPDDICMLSDMDEIPSGKALEEWYSNCLSFDYSGVWRFDQVLSYLYMNTTAGGWGGTKIFAARELDNLDSQRPMTDLIRYRPQDMIAGVIPNGGWHFSSCGGIEFVKNKLRSYAHTECAVYADNGRVEESFLNLVDPFNKNPLTVVDCENLPEYVKQNLQYFKNKGFIYTG